MDEPRQVVVESYNPRWKKDFQTEAQRVARALAPIVSNVHHIGSTSIEGLAAKPIIDLLVEVDQIATVDAHQNDMILIGYEALGENGIASRRYFQKKQGVTHTHHVHIFEQNSHDMIRHLAFRDYLIASPETAQFYGEIKQQLAEAFPEDIESYIKGKSAAAQKIEEEALQWWYDS